MEIRILCLKNRKMAWIHYKRNQNLDSFPVLSKLIQGMEKQRIRNVRSEVNKFKSKVTKDKHKNSKEMKMKKIMIIITIVQRSSSLSTWITKKNIITLICFRLTIGNNKIIRILKTTTTTRRWEMWIFKITSSKIWNSKKKKKKNKKTITKVKMRIRMINIVNQIIIIPKTIVRRVIVSSPYFATIHRCFNPSQDTTIHLIACKRKPSRNGKLRKQISHKDTRILRNRRFFRD